MAGKRFEIAQSPYSALPTVKVQTNAGDGVLEVGMLAMFKSDGSPYAIPLVTGDHTLGTDVPIYGLVAKDSTHTASADGVVEIYLPLPGITYRGHATTPANIDTQAKLDALLGDRVVITVSATTTAGDWTIDEDAGEAAASSIQLVAGNPEKGTVDFIIRQAATYLGDSQTS